MVATPSGTGPEAAADVDLDTVELWWTEAKEIASTELTASATIYDPARDQQDIVRYKDPSATDVSSALSDADSVGGAIVPFGDGAHSVEANTTLSNPLVVQEGGQIDVASGVTLNVAQVIASQRQIFTGSGTVRFTINQVVYAEWFGTGGAGLLAALAAIKNQGSNRGSASLLLLTEPEYELSSTMQLDFDEDGETGHQGLIIRSVAGPTGRLQDNVGGSRIKAAAGLAADEHLIHLLGIGRGSPASTSNGSRATVAFENIDIDGNASARSGSATGNCLQVELVKDVFLHRVTIHDAPQDGISGSGGVNQFVVEYAEMHNNGRHGAHLAVFADSTFTKAIAFSNTERGFNANGGNTQLVDCRAYLNGTDGFNISGTGVTQFSQLHANDNDENGVVINGSTTTPCRVLGGTIYVKNNGTSNASPAPSVQNRAGVNVTGSQVDGHIGAIVALDDQEVGSPATPDPTQSHPVFAALTGGDLSLDHMTASGHETSDDMGGAGSISMPISSPVPDGNEVVWGTDDDGRIRWDDAASGFTFEVDVGGSIRFWQTGGAAVLATMQTGGAVSLYHDGTNMLQTESTGINVDGRGDFDDELRIVDGAAAANEGQWRIHIDAGEFEIATMTDADGAGETAITIARTGTTVDSVDITNGTLTQAGTAVSLAGHTHTESEISDLGSYLRDDADDTMAGILTADRFISNNAAPYFVLEETDAAANNQNWSINATAEQFRIQAFNDAYSASQTAFTIDRTGTTIDTVNVPNGTLQYGGVEVATLDTNWDAGDVTSGTFADARIPSLATSKITSGTFADARIAESNVTQHQAALSVTESQISDLGDYLAGDAADALGGILTAGFRIDHTVASGNAGSRYNNNVRLQMKNSSGTNRDVFYMTTGNELWLGHTSHDLVLRGTDLIWWDGAEQKVFHTNLPTHTSLASGDYIPFVDVSETPDGANMITYANFESGLSITESQISDLGTYADITQAHNISGQWEWQDGVLAVFGNGADASLGWDNGNSHFEITLKAGGEWRVQKNTGEIGFRFIVDGATYMYHDNSNVIQTQSDGFKVRNGPTVTTGSAAPSASEPNGSIYLRTGGGSGTTFYVREAGAWVAK